MNKLTTMRCPRCKSNDLCYDSVLSAQFEKAVYICLGCGKYTVAPEQHRDQPRQKPITTQPTPAPARRQESQFTMRYVATQTICDLRIFATIDELVAGARLVAAQLRAQSGQPRFFLVILTGDGGYRGVFFPDDPYHREIVSEVANDAGLALTATLNERELLGGGE